MIKRAKMSEAKDSDDTKASDKFDINNNAYVYAMTAHEKKWREENGYIYDWMCMKEIKGKCVDKFQLELDKLKDYVKGDIRSKDKLCVLQKEHKGKCSFNPHVKMFNEKVHNKINTSIYETPGNDGYVYKNRSSRLHPIAIPCELERKIKNKDVKLKCAIPIKEMSTPYFLACAYTDLISLIFSMKDIGEYVKEDDEYSDYKDYLITHKLNLEIYYIKFDRKIFSDYGFLVCPVSQKEILAVHAFLDNRINTSENDVQLGHCEPKNEYNVTIRGLNLLLMSRFGNRIIGDNNFLENKWVDDLKQIVQHFK